jgi:iron-sulfur cluster assembly accessory protein
MDSRRSRYRPNLHFYPKENRNLAAGVSIKDIGKLERSELTRVRGGASCVTMVLHQISPNPAGSENTEMITVTPVATTKVKEIMGQQNPAPVALRVAVVGGGCSGFSYHMAFENSENPTDNVYEFDGLKIFVDQMSEMYLEGVSIDYIETLEGAGFKFNNPNVKSTCGCGSSFSV